VHPLNLFLLIADEVWRRNERLVADLEKRLENEQQATSADVDEFEGAGTLSIIYDDDNRMSVAVLNNGKALLSFNEDRKYLVELSGQMRHFVKDIFFGCLDKQAGYVCSLCPDMKRFIGRKNSEDALTASLETVGADSLSPSSLRRHRRPQQTWLESLGNGQRSLISSSCSQ